MDVDNMYVLCKDLLNYDLNNILVPEDQAHLDNRIAIVLEDVTNRYNERAKVTEMLGYTVMTAGSTLRRSPMMKQ
eukprot:11704210-Prorocentrum_lima.AAC.1